MLRLAGPVPDRHPPAAGDLRIERREQQRPGDCQQAEGGRGADRGGNEGVAAAEAEDRAEQDPHPRGSVAGVEHDPDSPLEVELWSSPLYFVLMLLVLTGEWALRKMSQLK